MDDIYVSGVFDLNSILDKSEDVAVDLLKKANREYRIKSRDGKACTSIENVRPNRVNLHITDGVVSSYTLG